MPNSDWNFNEEISGSFAEQRWEYFKRDSEGLRSRYGEENNQEYVRRSKFASDADEVRITGSPDIG